MEDEQPSLDTYQPSPLVEAPARKTKPEAKNTAPTVKEWQDFIGRVILKGLTNLWLNYALKDIEEMLTPHERKSITLEAKDLEDMAAPLANMANKSKIARKHGRQLIAAADSYEAVLAMVIWARRVNRISRKYRRQLASDAATAAASLPASEPLPPEFIQELQQQQIISPKLAEEVNTNGNPRQDDGQGFGPGGYPIQRRTFGGA